MKTKLLIPLLFTCVFNLNAQDDNPFESIGKQGKILTLSKGKYKEIHINDSLQQIGSAIINMNTGMIYELLNVDTLYSESNLDPTIISRWYSPDPIAHPWQSPYCSMNNNPILYSDPTGESGIITITASQKDVNGNTTKRGVVTVSMNLSLYGDPNIMTMTGEDIEAQNQALRSMLSGVKTMTVNGEEFDLVWDTQIFLSDETSCQLQTLKKNLGSKLIASENWARLVTVDQDMKDRVNKDHQDQMNGVEGTGFLWLQQGENAGNISSWGDSKLGNNIGVLVIGNLTNDNTVIGHELLHGLGLEHKDSDYSSTVPDGMSNSDSPAAKYQNMDKKFVGSDGTLNSENKRQFTQMNLISMLEKNGFQINSDRTGINVTMKNGTYSQDLGKPTNQYVQRSGKCEVSDW